LEIRRVENGDGTQSLDLAQFQKMMNELAPYIQLWNESRKRETSAAAVAGELFGG